MADPWRWSTGKKGVSRVTVFERPDATSLFIEWWDDNGRNRRALTNEVGVPVTDKELAREIAQDLAAEQERIANKRARTLWRGFQPGRTLGELLREYQSAHWDKWSEGHRDSQRRYREFWEEELGKGRRLIEVSASRVEAVADGKARAEGWSPRTVRGYLQYIVAAFTFAEKKLKWIDARHNLSAVDLPAPKRRKKNLRYTLGEALEILPALHQVDERAGAFGEVAFQAGRRLNAIRNLAKADFEDAGEYGVLRFRAESDKADQDGSAAITGEALAAVRRLLSSDGPWLFPRLTDSERPIRSEKLNELLHEAEGEAGIEHVQGRAWHAFKRLAATLAANHSGARHQFSTRRETLEKIYEADTLGPKLNLAERLERARRGR